MSNKIHLICLLLLICIGVNAQTSKTISGVVTDSSTGETLIGVSVVEPGTTNGTTTDIDGKFSITIKGDKLLFSYVGFISKEMTFTESTHVDVKLVSDTELDEIVIVGYTAMKKREVLGSLSKVNSKELNEVPAPNVSEALQGRVSGLQVTSTSGAPGAGVSVRVRGVGSIYGSNDPLYIIDGIPSENGLNSINPSDIENVSVLKDASSAAIYGSRASNGVVLITTKKGAEGKLKVSYNGQFGLQTHGKLPKMVNTEDYIKIYNAAAQNDGRPLFVNDSGKELADINHLDEIFRTATMNIHELSLNGGKKDLNYAVSGAYYNQEGIIRNSDYEKFSGRANVNYKPISWLKLGVTLNGGNSKNHVVPSSGDGYGSNEGGSVVRYAFMRTPAIPTYDANGNFVDLPSAYFGDGIYNTYFGDGYNPLALAEITDRVKEETTFLGVFDIEAKLPYNVTWSTKFGVDYKDYNYKIHNNTWGTNDRINNPSSYLQSPSESFGWTANTVFNTTYVLNDIHTFNGMVGGEAIRYHGNDKSLSSSINGDTYERNKWAYSLLSLFAKVDYNYNYKYYLSALVREDGSSRFTKGNRWGTFYSLSAGWDVHEEDFMKSLTFINLLKLRAGWGAVGNQNIGNYAYADVYGPNSNYPFGGSKPSLGYTLNQLGNENLKWETSKQLNLGIDMSFVNGQYGFSVDYYNKKSYDMLLPIPTPPSTGNKKTLFTNIGNMVNRGLDIEIFARKQYKDMGYSASLNWGYLKNEVLKLSGPIQAARVDNGIYAKYIEEGYSIGSYYMYEMDGIFQNEKEILTSAYQGNDIKPGDVKYKDQNGDGVIDEKDRAHVGTSLPKQTLGLNLQGNYKNWDLSVFFYGAFGHKLYNQMATETYGFYRGFNVSQKMFDNYWRGEGTTNEYPRASWSAKSNNVLTSTRFLENADFFRLKNVQLGYTFDLKSKVISYLRVYANATNLFTLTGYSGIDPEMTVSSNSSAEGDIGNGVDWGTYPVAKSFTIGVNLTF